MPSCDFYPHICRSFVEAEIVKNATLVDPSTNLQRFPLLNQTLLSETRDVIFIAVRVLFERCFSDQSPLFEYSKKTQTLHNRLISEIKNHYCAQTIGSPSYIPHCISKVTDKNPSFKKYLLDRILEPFQLFTAMIFSDSVCKNASRSKNFKQLDCDLQISTVDPRANTTSFFDSRLLFIKGGIFTIQFAQKMAINIFDRIHKVVEEHLSIPQGQ